ncbi:carboxylesterase [Nitrincola tibetensis]|uniref:Carboxylesterase n=1 Tax=Nitrincola tibetensis TaxID=2219697 RepID=A0A364NM76_9GAMM|nr:carboxylesterase [Nitrincola tibetensis]RAU17985.1 carboxylesterase [Nitrincola tibetensis]
MSDLDYLEIEPPIPARHCVIWLHGLGANGHDFEPILPELDLPSNHSIRFIFPHAPNIAVTINGGIIMPAWYDILDINIERKVDTEQLKGSAQAVETLIEREIQRGIPSHNILLAGFSQGGAVVYHAALNTTRPLAGLLALSTYFATPKLTDFTCQDRSLPVLIQHGLYDDIVPETLGQQAKALLTDQGFTVEYETFPMEHSLCLEQVKQIGRWLTARLS